MSSRVLSLSRIIPSDRSFLLERKFSILTLCVFFIGVFSSNSIIDQTIGYLLAMFGYGILALVLFYSEKTEIASSKRLILTILGLSVILSITTVLSLTTSSLIRITLFIPLLLINFTFIPIHLSRIIFYGTLARLTAIIILIGLPATIIGSFGPIQAHGAISKPPGFPIGLYGLQSVFKNPNTMGALAVYGALAALWEYFSTGKLFSLIIFITNSFGVYFSKGRAAALALVAGITLVGIYRYADHRALVTVTAAGFITAPVTLLIKFGTVPGPDLIRSIDLNNRVHLWTAAFQAMLDRPLFGWGIGNVQKAMIPYIIPSYIEGYGPHSSYLRMFVATGIVGGLFYTYIYLYSMLKRLRAVNNNAEATEYAMVISVIILHTFSGISLLGLSLTSVIPAIVLGYAQK